LNRRIAAVLMVGLALLAGAPAGAHDSWIDVSDGYPEPGDTLLVYVCSGHYFPKSETAVKDNVVHRLESRVSGNEPVPIRTVSKNTRRTGALVVKTDGVYVLELTLKRPKAKTPAFEARTLVVVNREADDPGEYSRGEGLELFPGSAVSGLKVGDDLPLWLALDGERMAGSLTVTPENGKAAYLKAAPTEPAVLRIRSFGKYLVTARVKGRGCSLVFEVFGSEAP